MMLDMVTEASIRYRDKVSVAAARTHIEQFHSDHGWVPPKFPVVDHFLQKVSKSLRIEYPEGRAVQGAFSPADMAKHCATLRVMRDRAHAQGRKFEAADLHEMLMAISAVFEVGQRTGNFCRGTEFEAGTRMWSKATIWWLMHRDGRMEGAKALQLPPPPLKTSTSSSEAAAGRTRQPMIYRLDSDKEFSFARACREARVFQVHSDEQAETLPAFMVCTRTRTAMSERDVAKKLGELELANPTQPEGTVIGTKQLRRGRIQGLELAAHLGHGRVRGHGPDTSANETINSISTHTGDGGRAPYSSTSMQAQIELGEAADEADFEAATKAYQFRDYKGGIPEIVTVRIRPDGKYVSVCERGVGQQLQLTNGPADGVNGVVDDAPDPDIDMFDDGELEAPAESRKRPAADKDGGDGVDTIAIQCVNCERSAAPGPCPKTGHPKKACSQSCYNEWKRQKPFEWHMWRKQIGTVAKETATTRGVPNLLNLFRPRQVSPNRGGAGPALKKRKHSRMSLKTNIARKAAASNADGPGI